MKTKFNYFPNHGDEEGRNGFTIYYSDHEDEDDPEEYLVGAEYTEEEAIEVCARLNGILVAYSDQQNKELRERIAVVLSDSALGAEIQRLTTENKELEEKLMSEQIENGYLQAFRVSNEAEIQRLREEVEELKNDLLDALDLKNGNGPTALTMLSNEITRLRELVTQYLDNSTSDNAYGADVRTRILNELSPKP